MRLNKKSSKFKLVIHRSCIALAQALILSMQLQYPLGLTTAPMLLRCHKKPNIACPLQAITPKKLFLFQNHSNLHAEQATSPKFSYSDHTLTSQHAPGLLNLLENLMSLNKINPHTQKVVLPTKRRCMLQLLFVHLLPKLILERHKIFRWMHTCYLLNLN